jgi:hypothetical protein
VEATTFFAEVVANLFQITSAGGAKSLTLVWWKTLLPTLAVGTAILTNLLVCDCVLLL